MRIYAVLLMTILSFQAFAANENPTLPKEINTIWRGDAGISEAEKLLAEKKYADVLTITDRLTIRNMRNADAHVLAASAWYSLGNTDKAKQSISNAIAIDKGHMGAYVVAGLISLQEDNKTQAEYYMGALRVVCQNDLCPEYQFLLKTIREYKEQ